MISKCKVLFLKIPKKQHPPTYQSLNPLGPGIHICGHHILVCLDHNTTFCPIRPNSKEKLKIHAIKKRVSGGKSKFSLS